MPIMNPFPKPTKAKPAKGKNKVAPNPSLVGIVGITFNGVLLDTGRLAQSFHFDFGHAYNPIRTAYRVVEDPRQIEEER